MNVKQKGETRVSCPGSGRGSIPKLEPDFFNIGSEFLSFIMPILETFGYPSKRNHQNSKGMKRKYCLIRTQGDLIPGSFVYVVWVGSSLRESAYLALVEEFCKDVGWYFKRWSTVVDSALELRSKMSRADGNRTATPYQMISISIFKCYQTIIDDSFATLEANHVMRPQEKFMRFRNDPTFLQLYHARQCNTMCPPSKRKYLRLGNQPGFYNAVGGIVLALAIFALDALATHIFAWL